MFLQKKTLISKFLNLSCMYFKTSPSKKVILIRYKVKDGWAKGLKQERYVRIARLNINLPHPLPSIT